MSKPNEAFEGDFRAQLGKKIVGVAFENDTITLRLEGGVSLLISDQGQNCCEERYLTVDTTELKNLLGSKFCNVVVKHAAFKGEEYDCEEIAFCEIATDDYVLSFSTHNKHNGFYGGFDLKVTVQGEEKQMEKEIPKVPTPTRFESIFEKVRLRGIELREEIFVACEAGEYTSLAAKVEELLALDAAAKLAQQSNLKANADAAAERVAKK